MPCRERFVLSPLVKGDDRRCGRPLWNEIGSVDADGPEYQALLILQ